MKYFIPILFLFPVLLFCSACADKTAVSDNGKINVVSVNFPGYDFAREIAEDNINLTLLLPPGAESHSFEPSPQDIIKIQNSDIFIYTGGESDSWVKEILASIKNKNLKIIAMMDLVNILEEELKEGMEEEHEHDEHHDDGGVAHHEEDDDDDAEYDEHVWTSPANAVIIVSAISDALRAADKENAEIYKANTNTYIERLKELDSTFRQIAANAKRKTLVFGDRFPFRYFVSEYGLDYYAAFTGCSTETEASAKTVAFLIDKVKSEKIPVVLHIDFSNEKIAKTICESTGAKNLLLHSCHNVSPDELKKGESYLSLMRKNVDNLKEALN